MSAYPFLEALSQGGKSFVSSKRVGWDIKAFPSSNLPLLEGRGQSGASFLNQEPLSQQWSP